MSNLTRRSMLGSLGAAALAGLLPFKPKAQDIVIATSMPPPPEPARAERVASNAGEIWPGAVLYDRRGREIAFVTGWSIEQERIDVDSVGGWVSSVPGRMRGRLDAELIIPVNLRHGRGLYRFYSMGSRDGEPFVVISNRS